MIRPEVLTPRPAILLGVLGGTVATLLLSALIYLAPAFGFPFIDFPRLVGGLFTGDPDVAFWLGYCLFFWAGVFVFPILFVRLWPALPGPHVGFGGALVKGMLWGLILWIAAGLLLPLLGALNQLDDQQPVAGGLRAGFFALNAGWLGAVGVLLGHVAYGIALALVTAMGQGIVPSATLGWPGYDHAETPLTSGK